MYTPRKQTDKTNTREDKIGTSQVPNQNYQKQSTYKYLSTLLLIQYGKNSLGTSLPGTDNTRFQNGKTHDSITIDISKSKLPETDAP